MRRKFWKAGIAALGALLLAGALGVASVASAGDTYGFGVSKPGGAWYPIGALVSRLAEKLYGDKVTLVIGGGASNALQANKGELQFGLTYTSTVSDASLARPPFKEKAENLRLAVVQYGQVTNWTVFRDSGIKTWRDLKGKRVNAMPRGFSQQFLNAQILKALGMSYKDFSKVTYLGLNDAVSQMKDGHLDAILMPGEEGYAPIVQLKIHKPIRILSFTQDEVQRIRKVQPAALPRIVKKEAFDLEGDVNTLESYQIVVTNKNVPEALVYKMAKLVYGNLDEFVKINASFKRVDPKTAAQDMGVPRHPGLTRYLKEIGAL